MRKMLFFVLALSAVLFVSPIVSFAADASNQNMTNTGKKMHKKGKRGKHGRKGMHKGQKGKKQKNDTAK